MGTCYEYSLDIKYAIGGEAGPLLDCNFQSKIVAELMDVEPELKIALDEDGCCRTETSWEGDDNLFLRFSEDYPDYIFVLSAEDQWSEQTVTFYYRGKMYEDAPQIIDPTFDTSRLR
jgi:hypothetical protein